MMKISDLVSFSFENLRRRKGRTILTVIGVVVGTCSIIVMVSLGIAINVGFEEMLSQWGDLTAVQIYNWGMQNSDISPLTDDVITQIEEIENVVVASPIYQSQYLNAELLAGEKDRYIGNTSIVGIKSEAVELLGYTLKSGEYLPQQDITIKDDSALKIPVIAGEFTAYSFADTKRRGDDAYIGQGMTDMNGDIIEPFVDIESEKISINLKPYSEENTQNIRYTIDVVGVLNEDYSRHYVTSQGLILDLDVLKNLEAQYMRENKIKPQETSTSGYSEVVVKVNKVDNVADVTTAIEDMGYSVYSLESERENMQGQSQMIQLILGALGGVSLFVAALSIANTMTMSIYERTKEIGVMKVLGCELPKIRDMFLLEAAMIGLSGGIVGIAMSYVISFALNTGAEFLPQLNMGMMMSEGSKISIVPMWLSVLALILSTIIGVLAGIAPANKASRISALEAIRRE